MPLGIYSRPAAVFDLGLNPGLCTSWVGALPLSYTLVSADSFRVDSCSVDLGCELIFQKWLTLGFLCAEVENWLL